MAFFNYVTKEITLKVVYYGPGLSGKTTNLQNLYSVLDASSRGKFISLATESDRTLFFDFLPVELGKIKDFSVRFQLYTVPGQIRYNATRKLVLKGADAVVFVADSQRDMREQNVESFANMRENLVSNNLNPEEIPVILQYNKRDLPDVLTIEELDSDLNKKNYQTMEAVASQGQGVQETFKMVTKTLLKDIAQKHKVDIAPAREEAVTVKVPEREKFDIAEEVLPPQGAAAEPEPPRPVIAGPAFSPQSAASSQSSPYAQAAAKGMEEPSPRSRPFISRTASYPDEKIHSVLAGLQELIQGLTRIRETISALSNEVRETGRQQTEAMRMLREISASLSEKKKKRRWFHFFSR